MVKFLWSHRVKLLITFVFICLLGGIIQSFFKGKIIDNDWLIKNSNNFQSEHIKFDLFNFDVLISNLGIMLPKQDIDVKVMDFRRDKTWWQKYENKEVERNKRYGAKDRTMVFFDDRYLSWKGGNCIVKEDLEAITRNVFKLMPHIRTTDESVALVVETAIAESDGGRIVSNKFGDHGVFQIKVRVSKDLFDWLKNNHKDIHDAIMALRNSDLSEKDNLEQNIPYACAICITEYWRKAGSQYYMHISSLEDRGKMWKSVYNTYKGYGTVHAFVRRNETYKTKETAVAVK